MQSHLQTTWLASSLLLLLAAPVMGADQPIGYRIIVHPDNPVRHLSVTELSDLFLKKEPSWPDGEKVEPVELVHESPVRGAFSEEVHGRSVSSIESYWQQMIFSGKAIPPPEEASDADVLAFVGSHRGAIGYVSLVAPVDRVKVVSVVRPPERIRHVSPVYPDLARRAHKEGIVLLNVVIDSRGHVGKVVPLTDPGYGMAFEAVRAVKQWRFEPPQLDGQATSATFRLSVDFQLP